MKKPNLIVVAAVGSAILLTGCLFPRYTTIDELWPTDDSRYAMTAEEASKLARKLIADPPAGRSPNYPGDKQIAMSTTSIRLREHNRTGYVLVEVKEGRRVKMEFYVLTKADGEKFAAAVWRLRKEYLEK